jgi:hypothetical protein
MPFRGCSSVVGDSRSFVDSNGEQEHSVQLEPQNGKEANQQAAKKQLCDTM